MVIYTVNALNLAELLNGQMHVRRTLPHASVLHKCSFLSLLISPLLQTKAQTVKKLFPAEESLVRLPAFDLRPPTVAITTVATIRYGCYNSARMGGA